jgi:hypothetical protein
VLEPSILLDHQVWKEYISHACNIPYNNNILFILLKNL